MKLFRRAQTATEYMIILAVIIIIALIVVGVMGGIPGLGGGSRRRADASYWQSAEIGITAYAITVANATDNTVTLKVRNNLKDTVRITNISLDGTSITWRGQTFKPGQTRTYSEAETNSTICAAAGNSFTADVEINYTDDETGASYTFNGEGNKLEGVCS